MWIEKIYEGWTKRSASFKSIIVAVKSRFSVLFRGV